MLLIILRGTGTIPTARQQRSWTAGLVVRVNFVRMELGAENASVTGSVYVQT